ncbi:MAG: restriction endonuclease [Terriglobia bacterium]
MRRLTIKLLCDEAARFAKWESAHDEPTIYGVDNGKTIGTYFEHKFQLELTSKYKYERGNSAEGIDFPELSVDMKTTSIKQPQSSCPYKDARQKIFGLGYCVLLFVYDKTDNPVIKTSRLNIVHTVFVEKEYTADYQMTTGLAAILKNNGNEDDVVAFLMERNLPLEEVGAHIIAKEILKTTPEIGYLTISNALQWRLQYSRVIERAGKVKGVNLVS